jgi:hypothetical protein
MKTIDVHRYHMLSRVSAFGAAHRDRFPAAGAAGRLFAAVSTAVDRLGANVTAQATGEGTAREGAISKAAAREALRQALEAIARTARALDAPELAGKFRLPSVRNDHELTTTATAFAEHAAPLRAELVDHGLPKTFLADLESALEAFQQASRDRFDAREAGASARAGIDTALESALTAVSRLDAVVANTLRDEPELLAAWTAARKVTRVRAGASRERADAVTPASGPAPTASSATPDTREAA